MMGGHRGQGASLSKAFMSQEGGNTGEGKLLKTTSECSERLKIQVDSYTRNRDSLEMSQSGKLLCVVTYSETKLWSPFLRSIVGPFLSSAPPLRSSIYFSLSYVACA